MANMHNTSIRRKSIYGGTPNKVCTSSNKVLDVLSIGRCIILVFLLTLMLFKIKCSCFPNHFCNAPIPRIRRRYGDVHMRGENTLTRTLSLSTGHNLHIHKGSSRKEVQEYLQKEVSNHNRYQNRDKEDNRNKS